MASEHANLSNDEHTKQNPNDKQEDNKSLVEANSRDVSIRSVSSSSSSSSSEGFEIGDKGSLYDSPVKSEFDGNPPCGSGSVSSSDHNNADRIASEPEPMKSSPVQTMGHPPGYDPNRIPASIFSTKPSTPTDWSAASNDSLFSIQMGNNSFTSGEPFWLEEWNNSQLNNQNGVEIKSSPSSSLAPVMEVPAQEEDSVKSGKTMQKEDSDKSFKTSIGVKMEDKVSKPEIVISGSGKGPKSAESNYNSSSKHRMSSSNPRLSDESGNSSSSFAFPVLVNDGGKTTSFKVVAENPEKPQLQPQTSNATPPKDTETRWFSCLCCWPRCC